MATLKSTDLLGGAAGATVTEATEPIVFLRGGSNLTYAAGFALDDMSFPASMQTSGAGDITIMLEPGQTHARICFAVQRVSGTQTTSHYLTVMRLVDSDKADAIIRNANGGNIAHRNNFTYFGQQSVVFGNGSKAWVEFEWLKGTGFKLHIWNEGNNTATPSQSFPVGGGYSAYTGDIDRVKVGNSGATAGLTVRYAGIRLTDGAPYRTGVVVPPVGTLNWNHNGYSAATEFSVKAKTTGAIAARLGYGTESDRTGQEYTELVSPDADGYVTFTPTGLDPATTYYWNVEVDGVKNTSQQGWSNTLSPPNVPASFTFGWGSCFDSYGSGVFGLIASRSIDFFAQLGDFGYQYITGGANGNTSPTDVATCRLHRETVLSHAGPQALFARVPLFQMYSDCDGGGANSDRTTGGIATGAVQAAWRQQFAHGPLPLSDCGARSWVVGRVRFIITDETTLASPKGEALSSTSKTKLGATQLAWFFAELLAAKAAGQVVVWFADGPWIEPTSLTGNSFRAYPVERALIGQFIEDNEIPIERLHGDTHNLFVDDGTNNPWGGFPSASAAPMHTTGQTFGYPISGPQSWPTAPTNGSRQWGMGEVLDDGDTLQIVLHGIGSTVAAPTEVERYTLTTTYTFPEPPQLRIQGKVVEDLMYKGQPAEALYRNSVLLWEGQ